MEHTMKGHKLTASFRLGSNPHWSIRYLITFVWPLCTALCRQVWPLSFSSNLFSQNRGIRTLTVSRSPLSAATWSVVSKFCNIEAIKYLWNTKCNAQSRTDMLTGALCHQSALWSIKLFTIWLWLFITAQKRGVTVWCQKQEAERKKVITFTDCKCRTPDMHFVAHFTFETTSMLSWSIELVSCLPYTLHLHCICTCPKAAQPFAFAHYGQPSVMEKLHPTKK